MAYLHADGADTYSVAADVLQRWDSISGAVTLVAAASTAFGVGGAISISSASALTKAWASNEGTLFLSLRHKVASGSLASTGLFVQLSDVAGVQCSIRWNEDGSLTAYTGTTGGTLLGTATSAVGVGSWDSWQIKVVIHNTAGSIEVRKNGNATTPILNLSGVNTRGGGTGNNYANKISVGVLTASNPHLLDDFFLCSGSGAAPNDWTGDARAFTQAPNAAVQSQFSQSPSATTWGQLSTAASTNTGGAVNVLQWIKLTAPYSGTCSQIAMSLAAAITGKLNCAIYDDNAGAPGNLLAQGTEKTNPAIGVQTFTLGSTASVTKGASYWLAHWSNASTTSGVLNGTGAQTRMAAALTYSATFPSTGASASGLTTSAGGPYFAVDLTGISSASLVADTTQDGDTSYVYSATVGQEDLYSFPSLASMGITPASFIGILPFGIVKKSDSGARTIDIRAKSGATDAQAATNASPSLSYGFLGGFLATDPATSAAWALTAVDALQVGPKVAA